MATSTGYLRLVSPRSPTPRTSPAPSSHTRRSRTPAIHTLSLRYVTRAVHAVQSQLVQVHSSHRAAVDRLRHTPLPSPLRRTATSPRTASGRSDTSAAASAAGGPRSRAAEGKRGENTHIEKQFLTVLRLSEEAARATRHLDDLVACGGEIAKKGP